MKGLTLKRIGLGPVFVYESITSARRWQGYALRSLFLLFLLAALLVMWKNANLPANPSIRAAASFGESFYLGVIGTQLALVLLAAPAATAGAICLDRARGTLLHMLMTDLSDVEIVLGKLAARLVSVLGLLACTLPMMELLTLIGGVDPTALLGGFVVSVGVAVLGCCLAMVYILCAGAAITSLGLAMATWFSRLGRAVGMTVTLYVLVAVGWFFMMFVMFRGWGERPAMASPFMWAAALTHDVIFRLEVHHSGWQILWTIVAALFAAEVLNWTLENFDRRLSRIEDVVTRLGRPSRPVRILSAIYVSFAVLGCVLTWSGFSAMAGGPMDAFYDPDDDLGNRRPCRINSLGDPLERRLLSRRGRSVARCSGFAACRARGGPQPRGAPWGAEKSRLK